MATILKDVSKSFGTYTALQSVNFTIEDGEFVAILGPSGCGKTTLLRLLAGFERPSSGMIMQDGAEISNADFHMPPERRNIGIVFQSFALWPHMNVRDHITFPLKHHRFLSSELKGTEQRVDEVLDMVGLRPFMNRMPNELSGGQKQRVALARAIAPKPALLLMDEPLSSLDAELRMDMRKEIQQLHRMTGASIIYVTHDQGEALAMADKIIVMRGGHIEQIGTPRDIYCHPATSFVATFVGKANLVRGTWKDDTFIPNQQPDQRWNDTGVQKSLKEQGIYPVRPEQFKLTMDAGVSAVVVNVQFQGKETHYTVDVQGEQWTVHTDTHMGYRIGDHVKVCM